ncbi:MAG: holo-ACP synthase [Candidatus Margulisbacteria bacterium]|nr:holo-ACP synthase [Candidatus Margulisiibacteriota bacterium]
MLKGIGIDIIEIERIKNAVDKYGETFLRKVYNDKEIKYCQGRGRYRYPELAVRFAAKEAFSKAIGLGIAGFGRNNHGIKWKDVEIKNNHHGKPLIYFKGQSLDNAHISLSHSRDFAVASVYVEE